MVWFVKLLSTCNCIMLKRRVPSVLLFLKPGWCTVTYICSMYKIATTSLLSPRKINELFFLVMWWWWSVCHFVAGWASTVVSDLPKRREARSYLCCSRILMHQEVLSQLPNFHFLKSLIDHHNIWRAEDHTVGWSGAGIDLFGSIVWNDFGT